MVRYMVVIFDRRVAWGPHIKLQRKTENTIISLSIRFVIENQTETKYIHPPNQYGYMRHRFAVQ